MRVIVTFSGGKDSLAALLWTREHITKNFTTVFCDTGWEHPLTYEYIHRIADKLHLDLVTLKSKKYAGMVDLSRRKRYSRRFRNLKPITNKNCKSCERYFSEARASTMGNGRADTYSKIKVGPSFTKQRTITAASPSLR